VDLTLTAAKAFAAGSTTAAASGMTPAAALAEGVLQVMWLTKLTKVTAVLFTACLLGLGVGAWAFRTPIGEPGSAGSQEPAQPAVQAPAATTTDADLAKARLKAARDVFDAMKAEVRAGRSDGQALAEWSSRLLEAELDAATTKKDRLAALEAHLAQMKEFKKQNNDQFDAGRLSFTDLAKARFALADAEWRLAREKAQ
jgi:hypothetical protein